jgi:uncharacterized protein involved in exopolysaccharide biosynthesis
METQSLVQTRSIDIPATFSRPPYSVEPQKESILGYWHTIWRRKAMLAGLGALGLGLGIGAALLQSPAYLAKTSLEIQDSKDDNLGAKILNPQPDFATPDSSTDIQTQINILQSQSLIERALQKSQLSGGANALQIDRDRQLEKVSKNLKVSAVAGTRIVDVSYQATSPVEAARFTNLLASEFIQQNLEARLQLNQKTSDWLTGQLAEVRGTLQRSEDALQSYARAKGLIYTDDKQTVSEDKLRELQTGLLNAQADRVAKQAKFEIAQTANPDSVPEALNDPSLRAMEVNVTDLRKQAAEMAVTFKPDYIKTKRLQAEIDSIDGAIKQKRAEIIQRMDNELQESRRREELLAGAYAKQTRQVSSDSENSIQYDVLKHDVDTNRQIYQVMLQRVKESSITSALKAPNVRVIDPARVPSHPYKPNLPMNAVGGLLAGLMMGIAGVVVLSKADGTILEPGDAESILGIPELGVIPTAIAPSKHWGAVSLFHKKTE